ncbi:MAG: hypothetical protein A2148_05750 [Chloroflexi bacterium RBG_16_68_14]|nr:MAG: hypothetical protein A2148_05750 [Chloroflexi bacterium RBG_16_68_14]
MEPRIQYAKTPDGVSLAYLSLGHGYPIVCVPSAWGTAHMYRTMPFWRAAIDPLVDLGWRLVLYDGRGMGSSDHRDMDYSLATRVNDLKAIVGHLKLEGFALFGILGGGPVAIAYAVQHPQRVSHLVLASTYVCGEELYREVPVQRVQAQLWSIATEQWELFTLTLANAIGGFADSAQAAVIAQAMRASMSPAEYLAWMEATEAIDVRELLPQVPAPTLVMHLPRFPNSTLALAQAIATGIPGAQLLTTDDIPNAIHEFLTESGAAPRDAAAKPDTGFRTILFTDVVGHTEMMLRLGDDRGRELLREQERTTREVLGQHLGTEVKTMGDGFMASFSSVTRAVECAIALQRAFGERNQTAAEPLHIRVGLNAGEPIEEEGDLFGAMVILAARIAAKAAADEILASLAVRELCAGKGFLFSDRGEAPLRGFEDPVRLYEVRWRVEDSP